MGYTCPICNNEGVIRDEQNNITLCECIENKRLISLYKEVGLPLRFLNIDLDQYSIKQDAYGKDIDSKAEKQKIIAKNVVSNFIEFLPAMIEGYPFVFEKEQNGQKYSFESFTLVLSGQKDSGKSMLSACIAKGALQYGIRPYYLEWSEVINACFDYYSDASAKNQTKIQKYENIIYIVENAQVLILDNLDKSYENINRNSEDDKLTSNVRRQIDAMFSVRSKISAPTVITTNQSFKELVSENKYGPVLLNILDDSIKIELPTLGKSDNALDMKKVN